MKAMLCFPPNWNPAMPHLALPTLAAFLRGHGVEVIQRDLNIEVFDTMLTRNHLETALERLERDAAAPRDRVAWALEHGPRIAAAARPVGDPRARRRPAALGRLCAFREADQCRAAAADV